MWALRWAILVGGVGTSEIDSVVVLGEDGENFRAMAEFTSLVHDDVLVGDIRGIASKPTIQPLDGGGPWIGKWHLEFGDCSGR